MGMMPLQSTGLPHSDTPGSMAVCAYPGIFAAYRVLHRLLEPRHPPSALDFFLYDNSILLDLQAIKRVLYVSRKYCLYNLIHHLHQYVKELHPQYIKQGKCNAKGNSSTTHLRTTITKRRGE